MFISSIFFFCCLQVTLSGFRSGKFSTLVATNVAARGLDIDDVQLIIQVCFDKRAIIAFCAVWFVNVSQYILYFANVDALISFFSVSHLVM